MYGYFLFPVSAEKLEKCESAIADYIKADNGETIDRVFSIEIDKEQFTDDNCEEEAIVDSYLVIMGEEDYGEKKVQDILYSDESDYLKRKEALVKVKNKEKLTDEEHYYISLYETKYAVLGCLGANLTPEEELEEIFESEETDYGKIVKTYK